MADLYYKHCSSCMEGPVDCLPWEDGYICLDCFELEEMTIDLDSFETFLT